MKIAITGAAGLFGYGLTQVFNERHTVVPLTHGDVDITRAEEVEAVFSRIRPEIVIHAAAIPNPDTCEGDPARAYAVNVHGTRHVCGSARNCGARVVYISTDAVFDGLNRLKRPYREGDPTGPLTVYGRTKLRAEGIVQETGECWIFRVSVLFGPGKENFVDKGLRRIEEGKTYVAPSNQLGNASYTLDLARAMCGVIEAKKYGLYHLANSGSCTRLELARRAAEMAGLNALAITGKTLDEMERPARRLPYSVMDCNAFRQAGFPALRAWDEALQEYIAGLR